MKKKICLLMAGLLVILTGCGNTLPLNEQITQVDAGGNESMVDYDEDYNYPDEQHTTGAQADSVTLPTEVKTTVRKETTEKQTTREPTTQRQTTAAEETTTNAPETTTMPEEEETTRQSFDILGEIIEGITELGTFLEGSDEEEEADVDAIDPDKPLLALTFDDGPSAHTDRLLDVFKQHGGKATFFVVGNIIDRRPDTVRRIVDEGHEIGNHSWAHSDLSDLSKADITDQLKKTNNKIYEVTGTKCKIARPPYGAYNDTVKQVGVSLDLAYIMWSVDTLDWKTKNEQAVYDAVMQGAKDGAIILCHDLHKTTVDAMESAIPDLLAEGYQLVTVSEMLTARGGSVESGKVYNRLK